MNVDPTLSARRYIQRHGGTDECLQRLFIDLVALLDGGWQREKYRSYYAIRKSLLITCPTPFLLERS
jgi:hypothetical protein